MERKQNDSNLFWYRPFLIHWVNRINLIIAVLAAIFNLFIITNFRNYLYIAIGALILLILIERKKMYEFVSTLSIIFFSAGFTLQAYLLKSAYSFTFLTILIIITGLLKTKKFLILLVVYCLGVIVLFLLLGIFTLHQDFEPISGIALVNNTTAVLPLLLIAFGLAYLLNHIIYEYVAQLQQKNREIESQNAVLTQKLHEIKILQEMLPICAQCKKIRDKDNQWHQIEYFLRDNAKVVFTHGYCPECAEKIQKDLI
jgi:hypothetical protein